MSISMFDTRTLLMAVENLKPVRRFLTKTFFGNTRPTITSTIDIDIEKGKRMLAPFVSQRIGSTTMESDGFTTSTYKPPLVAPDYPFTGEDLETRLPGENIYSKQTPDDRLAILIGSKLATFEEAISRREEWMVAQALSTGKIPVIGEGINQMIDFQFTNKQTLSVKAKWNYTASDSTSHPIDDLKRWKRDLAKAGFTPTHVVMDTDAGDAFLAHPDIKAMFSTQNANFGTLAPRSTDPEGTCFLCRINEIGLDIYTYEEWYIDPADGVEKPLLPSGTVIMASANTASTKFVMAYASIIDVVNGTFSLSRVPKSWLQNKPPVRYLSLQSRPLPIPTCVDSWYVGTVL